MHFLDKRDLGPGSVRSEPLYCDYSLTGMVSICSSTPSRAIDTAYDGLSNGDDLAGVYIHHALPVVQPQLGHAGIRLAKIIDENF